MTCPHGFEKVTQCFDCMEAEGVGAPAELPEGPERAEFTIVADHVSDCPLCPDRIFPGDSITVTTRRRWVHTECIR